MDPSEFEITKFDYISIFGRNFIFKIIHHNININYLYLLTLV